MIISASRRTDIPSYYSDWFFNRLKEGYVYTRNPMNIHKISDIPLTLDVVDGIVLWTKNPTPMLNKIHMLKDYPYYFQFTVNSYGSDIEPNIPLKSDVIIPTFQQLSTEIGKEKVVWRYDPIFLNKKYTMEYHKKYFEMISLTYLYSKFFKKIVRGRCVINSQIHPTSHCGWGLPNPPE